MFTRIALFILINVAVLFVAAVVLRLLGLDQMLNERGGLNYESLLVFSAVLGFGGAFVSLLISKWIAKRMTRARVIERAQNSDESWLLNTTAQLAAQAGIRTPEVAIFPSPEPNAFATGASRNKSLVAVSEGLMRGMNREQVRAVLAHEIGHVANGDMVTMALLQGVLNTFVIFLSRIVGHFVDRVLLRNERGFGLGYFAATIAAQIVFGILASVILMWYSRRREFRADAAGARLAGRGAMISALQALKHSYGKDRTMPESMAAFGISPAARSGIRQLFMSHPPLDDRIQALNSIRRLS
ncbi:MAG: protease HtpX [Gammaproteobacteria bacterium]|nr:protease HtpX [Gammaproteobacteria bacterium]MXW44760.1 protease HtpX [Gammaproteobacteria bacterium]MYD01036.1 protease HtpX [Gammaproteobacteria bacterium]MYE48731.1 protease HtpX [Gammaproteobacteria bacterium]MYI23956.1 protease HtpX [Gammaproteobacteria bacterium]